MPPAHNKENELPDRLNLPAEMHALDGDELAEEQMRRTAELAKALHKETKGGKVLLSTAVTYVYALITQEGRWEDPTGSSNMAQTSCFPHDDVY